MANHQYKSTQKIDIKKKLIESCVWEVDCLAKTKTNLGDTNNPLYRDLEAEADEDFDALDAEILFYDDRFNIDLNMHQKQMKIR